MALKRSSYYQVKDGKAVPKKKHCPRCGTGIYLGEHADRLTCGKCGYTEFKKKI